MADDNDMPGEADFVDKTEIKPIELDDVQGRWICEPQHDITALEAMLISQMFAAIVVRYLKGDRSRFDWRGYLTRPHATAVAPGTIVLPNLARHFREVQ